MRQLFEILGVWVVVVMEVRLHGAQLVVLERRAHALRPLVTGPGAAVAARARQSARAERHFHVVRIARVHVCENERARFRYSVYYDGCEFIMYIYILLKVIEGETSEKKKKNKTNIYLPNTRMTINSQGRGLQD